ncbi:helix-turn-helix domain-containing protein [Paenibacillus sp. 2TAB23]|uniref:AlbA family DNA-binding domain-containing protein n=1 Tax=Paenibacillus sp. 2TAB23 TaxID=3233004 RepID=UPI003F96A5BB
MSLFHKPIEQITLDDLKSLMGDIPVMEGQLIDYKRELIRPEQLCGSVTSFANTQGGDLLIGIEEKEGVPCTILGVECTDVDKEKLRLLDIFRNGIEPRLTNIEIEFVQVVESRYVIVVRTKRSWLRPHRVKQNSKFYARQSNGKYELDVQQLRQMFLGSSDFAAKYAVFHNERVLSHVENFDRSPFLLLHFVPVSAFDNPNVVELSGVLNNLRTEPIGTGGENRRINVLGVYSESHEKNSKFQLFRNGMVEHASSRMLRGNETYGSDLYEKLKRVFVFSFQNYRHLGLKEPIYIFLSFYGVNGLVVKDIDGFYASHDVVPFEFDKMIFPEIFIEDTDSVIIPELVRPLMDTLWNAYGFSRCGLHLK